VRTRRLLNDERGAEIAEFALVFPIVAFLIFGLIYSLLAIAAHVSLAHAASRSVRYASIATDSVVGTYPTNDDVEAHILDNTPFFSAEACETAVAGEERENAPIQLDVSCPFPNPIGAALSGMRNVLNGSDDGTSYASTLQMSAHAEARRE
jgi:Flp pilus assembly pilin Flp